MYFYTELEASGIHIGKKLFLRKREARKKERLGVIEAFTNTLTLSELFEKVVSFCLSRCKQMLLCVLLLGTVYTKLFLNYILNYRQYYLLF